MEAVGSDVGEVQEISKEELVKKKVLKPGIIYLSYIPRFLTVKKTRDILSEYGEIRRMFLQPTRPKKSGKPSKFFTEGWVEFASRKIAKRVATYLNGKPIGGKRRSSYYDALWSMKYMPKFQWSHLHEKQAYDKASKQQKMRAQIAQVKREVDFYTHGVEKSKRLRKNRKNDLNNLQNMKFMGPSRFDSDQSDNEEKPKEQNLSFLKKVFGGSTENKDSEK